METSHSLLKMLQGLVAVSRRMENRTNNPARKIKKKLVKKFISPNKVAFLPTKKTRFAS
jgi:hypothetical protein